MTWIDRSYDVLGAALLVRCRSAACADRIAEHFGPMATDAWTTPDVVVECELEEPRRELFRARPDPAGAPLDGVRVQLHGMQRPEPWTVAEPPLLPLSSEPLRDRLVGLHAACVAVGPAEAICVVGERGAGKTTLALTLADAYADCAIMSDEWTFVVRRTRVALAFPQAVGINRPDGKRWRRSDAAAARVETGPRNIAHVLVLDAAAPALPERVAATDAFALLQPHKLAAGVDEDEAVVTCARLCREVPVTWTAPLVYSDRAAVAARVRARCL